MKLGNDAAARQDFLTALDMGFDKALIESALVGEPPFAKHQSYSSEDHEQGLFHHSRGYDRLRQGDYDNAVADMDKARRLIDPQLIHLYTPARHAGGLFPERHRLLRHRLVRPGDHPFRQSGSRRTIVLPITQPPTTTAAFPTSAKVATAGR